MYTKLQPAENIDELVNYLKSSDNENYCYRGQTQHYNKILPSLYRSVISEENIIDKRIWKLNSLEYYNKVKSKQVILKNRLRNLLIENLGRGIGNIIAQQYGLLSETLDITDDISVAAFFATRKYPDYGHYNGDENNKLGVIYRFRNNIKLNNLEQLEYLLNEVGHFNSFVKEEVWFDKRYRQEEVNEEYIKEYFQKCGKETINLYTSPVIISFSQCKDFTFNAFVKTFNYSPRSLMNSRLSRQKGGFIRPSIHLKCTVPKRREIQNLLNRNYYLPNTVIVNDVIGISDIKSIQGLDIFYFKHSNLKIEDIGREFLWPSEVEDDIYEFITNICNNDKRTIEYIEKEKTFIDDISKGIIDPGYKTLSINIQQEAIKCYQIGEYDLAEELFLEAIKIDSNHSVLYSYLGHINLVKNKLEISLNYYKKAISINPNNWNIYINLSALFHRMGNLGKAIKNIDFALNLNERRSEAYLQKAIIQTELGEFNRAIENLKLGLNFLSSSGQAGMTVFDLRNQLIIQLATCYYMLNDLENFDVALNNYSGKIDRDDFIAHLEKFKAE